MPNEETDLETRVKQFNALELPGQPQGMHMGTSCLVHDLWREVQRLRKECDAIRARTFNECFVLADTFVPFVPGLPAHHENNIEVGVCIRIAKAIRTLAGG